MKHLVEKLDRRALIGLGVLGAAGVLYVGAAGTGALMPCASETRDTASLKSLIRLGRIYLRQHPASAVALPPAHEAVLRNGREDGAALRREYEQAAARLGEERERDFEAGNMVGCDGWMIAVSEARFCAMLALAASTRSGVGHSA